MRLHEPDAQDAYLVVYVRCAVAHSPGNMSMQQSDLLTLLIRANLARIPLYTREEQHRHAVSSAVSALQMMMA